jgi:hypothetical protein
VIIAEKALQSQLFLEEVGRKRDASAKQAGIEGEGVV